MQYGFWLQNLAENLELTVGVRRVGELRVDLCSALQHWLQVLEDAHS